MRDKARARLLQSSTSNGVLLGGAMSCTHRSTCPLVRLFSGKPSLRIWTEHYCEGQHHRCARVRRAAFGQDVPTWLLPNGQSLEAPAQ